MKHNYTFRRTLSAMLLLMMSTLSWAYSFQVNGIYYNINKDGKSVEVTYKSFLSGNYSGDIVIPSTVTYNNKTYSVTSIGDWAFVYCSALTSISIPESVTSIGAEVFVGCNALKDAKYASVESMCRISYGGFDSNPCYYAENLYIGGELVTSISIPKSVTSIGNYAFYNCSSLTSISIPEGVTSIGNSAFYSCSSLTSISIPEGVTSIGWYAFEYCRSLTSISIPESVTSIGNKAFRGCSSLKDAKYASVESMCRISYGGFDSNPCDYAENLYIDGELVTSISIPEGVTSIGNYAFYNCSSLTSISIPESVTSIGSYAFNGCKSLKDAKYASVESMCRISYGGFDSNPCYYAENLYIGGELVTSISIPKSVTSIGNYAFQNCSSLTSISIPEGVTSIGYRAFYNCSSLTSISIPEGVTSIGHEAFGGCSSLTSISIPKGVTSIGYEAFYNCSSLTSISIPEGVTSIEERAIEGCSALTSISIPESLTYIGKRAFANCKSLKDAKYASVESMCRISYGDDFSNPCRYADNLYIGGELVTSISIPEGVTSIGSYAFYNCSALTSISIPESVTSIGKDAFRGCSSLKDAKYASVESMCRISYGGPYSHPCNYAGNLYIGGELVTSISIPEGVTSIGSYAFYECRSLTSIYIPESVTWIGFDAFWGCRSLTSISIPESVTSIVDGAFSYCPSITSITVAANNPIYDSREGCNAIIETSSNTLIAGCQNTIIPESVTSIGDYAFCGCSALTSISIPEGVTSIGRYAFHGCSSLTSISIPESVTSIGEDAFFLCFTLTSVICYAEKIPKLGSDDAFLSTPTSEATLYVPASALADYKAAYPWKYFGTILPLEDIPAGISNIKADETNAPYYTLDGKRVDTPTRKGIYIRNGKKILIK